MTGVQTCALPISAATAGHGGSLVDGYRLSFLIATGLAVLAAIIVALQLRTSSRRVGPGPAGAADQGDADQGDAERQLDVTGDHR